MASVYTTLAIIGIFFISPFIIPALVLLGLLYDFLKSELPPGIDQPLKLRVFNSLLVTIMILGKILKKLGICSDLSLLRVALDGIPPWRDSKLLIRDLKVDEVPLRIYQPKAPPTGKRRGILYFHGGAGTFGSIRAFERICRHIAKKCNAVVVSVGYRLAPEHPYPGQYFDCLNATLYFMRNLEEYHVDPALIIISGDSCGANFATVICQILLNKRDLPKVRAQVLLYPGLQALDFHLPSYQQNASVPILFRKLVIYFCFRYLNKEPDVLEDVLQNCHVPESMKQKYKKWISADNIPDEFKIRGYVPQKPTSFKPEVHEAIKEILAGTFSPLLAEDSIICQMPESYIVTCEFDVLRDDGLLYKKRLEDNGVKVTWYHSESGFHGIVSFFGYGIFSFLSAKKIMDNTVNFINSL
ncbi:arylacetamide deacetylase-like 4 [Columba livia]|uniref:Arylacetamide deacetylase-like 4 n=1 Tax=Columba livia TaxID=8932 RepID=A0A2I0M356_COLLI|nr:arylacetamide deacetylase-like 4 [Columba livia]PKK24115.1 arylacetamide deacetylase-like 4 [Columba livia]